jgi:hypothetical protein
MLTSDRREFLKQSIALAPAAEAAMFARSARAADTQHEFAEHNKENGYFRRFSR